MGVVREARGNSARWLSVASALFAFAAATAHTGAQERALSANELAAKVVRTDVIRWQGARSRVRMLLIDAKGERSERVMDVIARRVQGLAQTLVRFVAPPDIAGTAFLMLDRAHEQPEQYLYLPALKRTRRIVGREREGSFMGSDFSYADLSPLDAAAASHRLLPDEQIGSDPVYVLESTPQPSAALPYGKITTFVRKRDFLALRTRFFDRAGKLLKTLYSRRVRDIEGKPVVVEARMQNQADGHATELYIDAIEQRSDLSDADFTPAALEHM